MLVPNEAEKIGIPMVDPQSHQTAIFKGLRYVSTGSKRISLLIADSRAD